MSVEIVSEGLGEDFDENYHRFLEEAFATGCVWGLEGEEGWALCPSNHSDDVDVLPLWSQPEYVKPHLVEEWAKYKVVPIALEELMDDWLPGLHEEVTMIGPNWNTQLEGGEVEPLDLLEDFDGDA